MTKKHFQLIARAMRDNAPNVAWINKRQQWRYDCRSLAYMGRDVNASFNFETFFDYCGFDPVELRDMLYSIKE